MRQVVFYLLIILSFFSCKQDENDIDYNPIVESFLPENPTGGDILHIKGTHFGIDKNVVQVLLSDGKDQVLYLEIIQIHDTLIQVQIPDTIAFTNYIIQLIVYDNKAEKELSIKIDVPKPRVTDFTPKFSESDGKVTVYGKYFGNDTSNVSVQLVNSIGSFDAKRVVSVMGDSLVFQTPDIEYGNYSIKIQIGEQESLSQNQLRVIAPYITNSETELKIGEMYDITGDNLKEAGKETQVFIYNEKDTIEAEIISISNDKIVIKVPDNLEISTYQIQVKVGDKKVDIDQEFTVTIYTPYLSHSLKKEFYVPNYETLASGDIHFKLIGANLEDDISQIKIIMRSSTNSIGVNVLRLKADTLFASLNPDFLEAGNYNFLLFLANKEGKSAATSSVLDVSVKSFETERIVPGETLKVFVDDLPKDISQLKVETVSKSIDSVIEVSITENDENSITIATSEKSLSGLHYLKFSIGNEFVKSSKKYFEFILPKIISIYPLRGIAGTKISISGSNFTDPDNTDVTFTFTHKTSGNVKEVLANVKSLFDMEVTLPSDFDEGGEFDLKITYGKIDMELKDDLKTFTILPQPKLTGVNKTRVHQGSTLSIYGKNLDIIASPTIHFVASDGTKYPVQIEEDASGEKIQNRSRISVDVKDIPVGNYTVEISFEGETISLAKNIMVYKGKLISVNQDKHIVSGQNIVISGIFAEGFERNKVFMENASGMRTELNKIYVLDTLIEVSIPVATTAGNYNIIAETEEFEVPTTLSVEVVDMAIKRVSRTTLNQVSNSREVKLYVDGGQYLSKSKQQIRIIRHDGTKTEVPVKNVAVEGDEVAIAFDIPKNSYDGAYTFEFHRNDLEGGGRSVQNVAVSTDITPISITPETATIYADKVDAVKLLLTSLPDETIDIAFSSYDAENGLKAKIPEDLKVSNKIISGTSGSLEVNINHVKDGEVKLTLKINEILLENIVTLTKNQKDISTFAQLDAIRKDLDGDYVLTSDIAFPDDIVTRNGGEGFDPIGEVNEATFFTSIYRYADKFNGSINGDGHTISGFYLKNQSRNGNGFIAVVDENGTIENLTIELRTDVTYAIDAGFRVGVFAGVCLGEIKNCHVRGDGKIRGKGYVGSIVGITHRVVENVSSDADVILNSASDFAEATLHRDSYGTIGGIVGVTTNVVRKAYMRGKVSDNGVTGVNVNMGGVVGLTGNSAVFTGVFGSVHESVMAGEIQSDVSSTDNIGGIIGFVQARGGVTQNCAFMGTLIDPLGASTASSRFAHLARNADRSSHSFRSFLSTNTEGSTLLFVDTGTLTAALVEGLHAPEAGKLYLPPSTIQVYTLADLTDRAKYETTFPSFDFDNIWKIPAGFQQTPELRFVDNLPPF